MNWFRRVGWSVLAIATAAIALAGIFVSFPEPENAIVIDRAIFQSTNGQTRGVMLPPNLSDLAAIRRFGPGRYLASFDLAAMPDHGLLVLVPASSQDFSLSINGDPIFESDLRAVWSEPMVRSSSLVRLPRSLLRTGRNELEFLFGRSRDVLPNHLTRIYVGDEAALATNFKWRVLFERDLKTMALAAQALLGIGILIAFLYRPKDSLFSWLAAVVVAGLLVPLGLLLGGWPEQGPIQPYALAFAPSVGLLIVGVAIILARAPPPRSLGVAIVAIPAILLFLMLSGAASTHWVVSVSLFLLAAAFVMAAGIVGWAAIWRGSTECGLMLPPMFLLGWFSARDLGIVAGFFQGSILFTPYVRTLTLAAVLAVLMRRLAKSLDRLDRANEELNIRLAEQEAELAELHRQERDEAARVVREQERHRLTRDLHDGISGHLVSIIAMAERTGDAKPIEQAAREALDDLRLVIYSLDLGDRELPLALASFRERLVPQLRRVGVELDWSTAKLPEVAGVTPGNALAVLRILQEAITNALKHGPARRIAVRGDAMNGMAAITIENDGRAYVERSGGHGIENMRARAKQLGGELQLCGVADGLRVTLLLPRRLADLESVSPG